MVQNLMTSKAAHDFQYQAVNYIRGTVAPVAAGTNQTVQIGTLPAGAVILGVHSRVSTAIAGGTPVLAVGSTAGGAELVATMAEAAGVELLQALVAGPFATDTPVWLNTSGGATSGSATVTVMYSNS